MSDKPSNSSIDPYVLIVGDDAWENYTPGRSDMMLLMKLDEANRSLYFISVPRDTRATYSDGSTIKANYAYEYGGIDAALEATREITGVDVNQYIVVGFDGFQKIVEYLGGVTVTLPYPIDYAFYTKDFPNEVYEAGEQTLTPWRAMALSRARTSYEQFDLNQDMMRQVVNRQMLASLAEAAFANGNGVEKTFGDLFSNVSSNIPVDAVIETAKRWADMETITIYGTSGPVDGSIDEETGLYLIPYAPEKWQALMQIVEDGGDPAAVDTQFPGTKQSDIAPIDAKMTIETK